MTIRGSCTSSIKMLYARKIDFTFDAFIFFVSHSSGSNGSNGVVGGRCSQLSADHV